ncbi:MAG: hypothetical protein EKK61_05945 [Rickettsiales bacterium]|nr:MAG: hypothetical protein EKK61_05945 [Rickettsiales bacterium]
MAGNQNTKEYEEGLKIAIDFLKGQIGECGNLKSLLEQKPITYTIIVHGFNQYTDDIIKWLKDNYSFKEIGCILDKIKNASASIEQDDNNSSHEYKEVTDEQLDELMADSDIEGSESDNYNQYERAIEEDCLIGESSSSDSE